MTTFTELQCFNKLLLQKLEQTQKKNEALLADVKVWEGSFRQLRDRYDTLVDLMCRLGALDNVFQCNECNEWKHMDYHACNESVNCDCMYVCEDCRDKVQWYCDGCSNYYCIRCEECEDGIHYINGDEYCNDCYEDVEDEELLTIEQTNSKRAVMEELVQKMAHSGI